MSDRTVLTLHILEALCTHAASGVSNTALASNLQTLPSNVTRAMQTLVAQGWARKDERTGLFYPANRVVQLSAKALRDMDVMQQQLRDTASNFARQI